MAIMEITQTETSPGQSSGRRGGRFTPHWSTSRVPWIVAGGLGLAAVVAALATWSVAVGSTSPSQQPGSINQFCQDMGGSGATCNGLSVQAPPDSGTDSSTDSADTVAF